MMVEVREKWTAGGCIYITESDCALHVHSRRPVRLRWEMHRKRKCLRLSQLMHHLLELANGSWSLFKQLLAKES
jgi:hypothetical protein